MTLTIALVAATPLTVLTGSLQIHKLTVQSASPSITKFYDSRADAVTYARAAYDKRLITGDQEHVYAQQECCGSVDDEITVPVATDAVVTIAANASAPLPEIASLADGCCCAYGGLTLKQGLTALSTQNATLIVEYDVNLQ